MASMVSKTSLRTLFFGLAHLSTLKHHLEHLRTHIFSLGTVTLSQLELTKLETSGGREERGSRHSVLTCSTHAFCRPLECMFLGWGGAGWGVITFRSFEPDLIQRFNWSDGKHASSINPCTASTAQSQGCLEATEIL